MCSNRLKRKELPQWRKLPEARKFPKVDGRKESEVGKDKCNYTKEGRSTGKMERD